MAATDSSVSLKSVYVPVQDGTRLAVDFWLPADLGPKDRLPAVFMLTRYWRSLGFKEGRLDWQKFYSEARSFVSRGFAFVVADSRGSGASFGTRVSEFSEEEMGDAGELIAWIADQQWSNGDVVSTGTSYSGNMAFFCALNHPPALRAIVPFAADFDLYSQLLRPGGLECFFVRDWGASVRALDQNDIDSLVANLDTPPPEPIAQNVTGVRPVDEDRDGALLELAIQEHAHNFDVGKAAESLRFRNEKALTESLLNQASIFFHRAVIEKANVPIHYRTGWLDAGTAQGALGLFNTFRGPLHVTIGPWNHGSTSHADPFLETKPQEIPLEEKAELVFESMTCAMNAEDDQAQSTDKVLDYYTYGENSWTRTSTWPPANTRFIRYFLAEGGMLKTTAPHGECEEDTYSVDPEATSGPTNRWQTNLGGGPVWYPERAEQGKKLLVYQTDPLDTDIRMTGHPVITLYISSNHEESDLLVYLEDVAPDGRVSYVTEGLLRLGNRRIEPNPPWSFEGPYHSYRAEDYEPLAQGEVAELKIGLFPISVLFKKGHRLRVAIGGADRGTFVPLETAAGTEWHIKRDHRYPSSLEIPVVPVSC